MNYFPWNWYVEYWFFVRMAIFRQNGKFRETKAGITLDLTEILLLHFILQLPLKYKNTSTTVEVWKYFNYSWSMNCQFHEIFNFLNSYFNYSWSIFILRHFTNREEWKYKNSYACPLLVNCVRMYVLCRHYTDYLHKSAIFPVFMVFWPTLLRTNASFIKTNGRIQTHYRSNEVTNSCHSLSWKGRSPWEFMASIGIMAYCNFFAPRPNISN